MDRIAMRYFTPGLYARFNSHDPDIADAADAEWDEAEVAYDAYLTRHSSHPVVRAYHAVFRDLVFFGLHDAKLLLASRREPAALTLLLQAYGGYRRHGPPTITVLRFDLFGEAVGAFPPGRMWWGYDEIEAVDESRAWFKTLWFDDDDGVRETVIPAASLRAWSFRPHHVSLRRLNRD